MSTKTNVIGRGYVLLRGGDKPSAVVSHADAQDLRRRFGGRIVSAKGLRYRKIGTMRVVIDADRTDLRKRASVA